MDDVSSLLEAGEEVEAVVIGYDRKNRFINLSISDLEIAEKQPANTSLGELLKEQMNANAEIKD